MADAVADKRNPHDLSSLLSLGRARELAGDWAGARDAFRRTVAAHPREPVARLYLAHALERLERRGDALLAYFRAITDAQRQGLWLNKASTPPAAAARCAKCRRKRL